LVIVALNLLGTADNDTQAGGAANDTIRGNAGIDYITGGDGNDSVFGDDGNDLLYGGRGNDSAIGSTGSDRLFGDEGGDRNVGYKYFFRKIFICLIWKLLANLLSCWVNGENSLFKFSILASSCSKSLTKPLRLNS
jgi:hypothetical protein